MNRAIVILAAIFGLSACATPPPEPHYRLSPGDRVGIMVDVGDTLIYTASNVPTGFSAARSTVDRYPGEWGIRRYVTTRLTTRLDHRDRAGARRGTFGGRPDGVAGGLGDRGEVC